MEFVTTMVNNVRSTMLASDTILSEAQRIIAGPCYDLATIQTTVRLKGHKCINVVTQAAQDELASYFMDTVDLYDLIAKLKEANYINSVWCKASPKSPWFAADAYRLQNLEKSSFQQTSIRCKYYLKFSINAAGEILLLFSIHRDIL